MVKDRKKIYYAQNSSIILEKMKEYYAKNSDKIKKKRAEYREKNKTSLNIASNKYYHTNKEHLKVYRASYYRKNYDRLKEKKKEYENSLLSNSPTFKLIKNLRRRILSAIKHQSTKKSGKSFELLGCSAEEVVIYLESEFKDGMSWENHGSKGWHIDHILPCASFNLADPEEQKKCFHYTNLQPLWWSDNLEKGDRLGYVSKNNQNVVEEA